MNAVKTLSHFLNASGAPPAAEDAVAGDAALPPAMLQVRAARPFFLASTAKCVYGTCVHVRAHIAAWLAALKSVHLSSILCGCLIRTHNQPHPHPLLSHTSHNTLYTTQRTQHTVHSTQHTTCNLELTTHSAQHTTHNTHKSQHETLLYLTTCPGPPPCMRPHRTCPPLPKRWWAHPEPPPPAPAATPPPTPRARDDGQPPPPPSAPAPSPHAPATDTSPSPSPLPYLRGTAPRRRRWSGTTGG